MDGETEENESRARACHAGTQPNGHGWPASPAPLTASPCSPENQWGGPAGQDGTRQPALISNSGQAEAPLAVLCGLFIK